MSLDNIFAKPYFIEDVGHLYPVRLEDYDKFNDCSSLLQFNMGHFEISEDFKDSAKLLDVLLGISKDSVVKLELLFSLVCRKQFTFVSDNNTYAFFSNDRTFVSRDNFDDFREIVMKQNLLFEHKVFKNKITQQWAEKVLKARSKNAPKISMEDIITTVSLYKSKNYEELMGYTIYQIYADFYRIRKREKYNADIIFATVSDKVAIEDFAEEIQMIHNPYDDLFVNKNKLNNLNKAMGEG